MVDFLSLMPPEKAAEIRAKIEADTKEMARLHALPDRWLGEAVLAMARKVREGHPRLGRPDEPHDGYASSLVWQVVPFLAKRLGCVLKPNEANDPELVHLDGAELRERVSTIVHNVSSAWMCEPFKGQPSPTPASFLTHDIANGNPVTMMLDRVVVPHASSEDWCARYVREISAARGVETASAWAPTMQDYGKHADLDDSGAMAHEVEQDEEGPSIGM